MFSFYNILATELINMNIKLDIAHTCTNAKLAFYYCFPRPSVKTIMALLDRTRQYRNKTITKS